MDENVKRWLPAIGLGVVLAIALVVLAVQSFGGDDGEPDETSTTVSTSTTVAPTTSSSTSTSTSTTAAPATTAPPTAPTTATTTPPTTTTTRTGTTTTTAPGEPADPDDATVLAECADGNPFACYDVGARGLTPPAGIGPTDPWRTRTDQQVDDGCGLGQLPACFEAGRRGRPLG